LQGNMEQNKLNALVTALQTPMTTYGPCIATLLSLVFYTRVQVGYPAGKNFNGNAGGIAAIPGGTGGGDIYTDDLARLYNDTVSFTYVAAAVYLGIQFYDADHILLGHYEGGGAYAPGGGAGTGQWG